MQNTGMKKYIVLSYLFKRPEGLTAQELAEKTQTALPNLYTQLAALRTDGLITKKGKTYIANPASEKARKLILLREIAPKDYLFLISPGTEKLLRLLAGSKSLEIAKNASLNGIRKTRQLHRLKIALITKKMPLTASLRANETIARTLLDYFNIVPRVTADEYLEFLEKLEKTAARKPRGAQSDKGIKQACDEHYVQGGDYFLDKARAYAPDERIMIQLAKIGEITKQHAYYLKSLPEATRDELEKQRKYRYVYNTNRIEGNPLTASEVTKYITAGTFPRYAKAKDLHETINTAEAFEWAQQKSASDFDGALIKDLHYFIEKNISKSAGKYKAGYNVVGNHPTTPPVHVKERMRSLMTWYRENKDTLHPFILASVVHQQFVMIHPFQDGNGRVARLIFNLLISRDYFPVTFEADSKERYYQAIENNSMSQFLIYATALYTEQYL